MTEIFVCYSHLDQRWLDPNEKYELIPWLANALRHKGITFWYDRSDEVGLRAGDHFRDEIEQHVDRAEIALLLLSEAFFASDFIQDVELPRIMARAGRGRGAAGLPGPPDMTAWAR